MGGYQVHALSYFNTSINNKSRLHAYLFYFHIVPVEKPGYCPYFNLAASKCASVSNQRSVCSYDAHCPGKQKCCRECSMACKDPGIYVYLVE